MRIALVALLLLTGCGQEATLKREIAAVMKDPESAKFGDITIIGEGEGRVACGSVNGKNALGGYTGKMGFMVKGQLLFTPVTRYCCTYNLLPDREPAPDRKRDCEAKLPPPVRIGSY